MNLNYKIAIINPYRADGLARTVLDGLLQLKKASNELDFFLSSEFDYSMPLKDRILGKDEFINFARIADATFLIYGKEDTNYDLAREINLWDKTVFIDGSEVGKNRRYDLEIQDKILDGKYRGNGAINFEMLEKCALYFRRERPYIKSIIPLPFGIESRYLQYAGNNKRKDIDFFCVFGQEKYPILRKHVKKKLIKFCKKNNFIYHVKKTKTSDEFYELLSMSKVGISVGGGGYDTMRFWEIFGNNCLLLTEKIDIYKENSDELDYKRIWQFNDLNDFQDQLEKIGKFLQEKYNQQSMQEEYKNILLKHSSKARVLTIFDQIFGNQ
ncbi:hypothetical protein KAU19_04160 [Candidatus Parcubacteria bacterium]|nr:hypothetical protein [Candidatus Parcubacteria bacterium]